MGVVTLGDEELVVLVAAVELEREGLLRVGEDGHLYGAEGAEPRFVEMCEQDPEFFAEVQGRGAIVALVRWWMRRNNLPMD